MTTTKRKALHGRTKDCLNYIMNLSKTDQGTLITGLNCNADFAYEEMCMINRLYGNSGNRVGYHVFQNFNYIDDITPEKAHELGVQLTKELYPDYQCVVATHIDKAHIHNHICLNSINIKTGKKLVDKLNHPEGIAHLREVSDRISKENGLTVIEEAPPIGKYNNKKFLYNYANKSWRKQMKEDINHLIVQAESFDHLLALLESTGYRIKKGKYIKVKPIGAEKFFRLDRIDKENYSEKSIKQKIYENNKVDFMINKKNNFKKYNKLNFNGILNSDLKDIKTNLLIKSSRDETLLSKQESIIEKYNLKYTSYQQRQYKIKVELNKMKNIISILNKMHISNYNDLLIKIDDREILQNKLKEKYEEMKLKNYEYQDMLPFIKIYMELYSLNELIDEENIINNRNMKHTYQNELKMFEEANKELNKKFVINNPDDAKIVMVEANKIKREVIDVLSKLRNNINELNALYGLKNYTMDQNTIENNLFKGFCVNANMIDKSKTTESKYCIKLPHTQDYLYVYKDQCSWFKFGEKLQIYFIDEQEFEIYDKEGKLKYTKNSNQLCQENKSIIDMYNKKIYNS